jgi:hypothetical protein
MIDADLIFNQWNAGLFLEVFPTLAEDPDPVGKLIETC